MDSTIWTEKYRPKTFSEISGQEEVVKRAKAFVANQNMPHLLFAGPAGVRFYPALPHIPQHRARRPHPCHAG